MVIIEGGVAIIIIINIWIVVIIGNLLLLLAIDYSWCCRLLVSVGVVHDNCVWPWGLAVKGFCGIIVVVVIGICEQ